MKFTTFITAVVLSASPIFAQGADGQKCGPIADGLSALKTEYGEDIRMIANRADGGILVITVSPSGTWSALMIQDNGIACLGAWGEGISFEAPGADM